MRTMSNQMETINKNIEMIKMNQIVILVLKSTVTERKYSLEVFQQKI